MFVRYASQLVKEGVSLLRWVTIIFLCLYMGKRALQLEHWARSAILPYNDKAIKHIYNLYITLFSILDTVRSTGQALTTFPRCSIAQCR